MEEEAAEEDVGVPACYSVVARSRAGVPVVAVQGVARRAVEEAAELVDGMLMVWYREVAMRGERGGEWGGRGKVSKEDPCE